MKFILQLVATLLAALGLMSAANAAGSFMQIYQGTAGNTPGNTISCGTPAVGTSVACPAVRFQFTACSSGGCDEAYYQNSNVTVSNTSEFSASVTSCSTTSWVGSGVVCTVWLTYTPTATGSHNTSVILNGKLYDWYMTTMKTVAYSFSANGGVAASYDWNTGSWSAWSSTCSDAATRTRTVTCLQDGSTSVDDSFCAGAKPTASETSGLYSGCSYAWSAGAFGACAGGSGSWQVGSWAPALGCGSTTQSRSVTCAVDVNSGTHSRTVTCLRSDGAEAASELCGAAPATSESCTPADTAVCGTAPADTQTDTLTNDCPSEGGGDDEGDDETPTGPTPVKKELCAPDAANHKYCVWMPL